MFDLYNFKESKKHNFLYDNFLKYILSLLIFCLSLITFFLIFTFVNIFIKLFTRDFMNKKIYKDKKSYWKLRAKKLNSMKKQY